MKTKEWTSLPILDAFRPETGWKTDHAIFGSYSADPVALLAILLALAGRDDERGSGTAIDVAEAIEELRGKVTFLIQSGRVSIPFRAQTVLKVLDRFVREMYCNEAMESWHPKVALIRQSSENEDKTCWRFWMGSRNFTRDQSWDAGLLLVGQVADTGKPVPGLVEAAKELWSRAGFRRPEQNVMAEELNRVRWIHPPGCKVEEIQFLLPRLKTRGLPRAPRHIESLLLVSPFLDGKIVNQLGEWGNPMTHRTLLSTRQALSGIAEQKGAPLNNFHERLYMADVRGDESLFISGGDEAFDEIMDETDEEQNGLHAKLILARCNGKITLWLGSPNATIRGWEKNYEIIARLAMHEDLADELINFTKEAQVFDGALKSESVSHEEEAIEEAHKQVASRWHVRQKNFSLYTEAPPHPDDPNILLEVGILGGELVQWPKDTKSIGLRHRESLIETEFVQIRVSLGNSERRWLQKAPLDPAPGIDRDRRAVATLLNPRTFLKWIRSLLDDELLYGGDPWDSDQRKNQGQRKVTASTDRLLPALEDILKAWSRTPGVLKVVDARMKAYMEFIRASADTEDKDLILLREFEKIWNIVSGELLDKE